MRWLTHALARLAVAFAITLVFGFLGVLVYLERTAKAACHRAGFEHHLIVRGAIYCLRTTRDATEIRLVTP